MENSQNSVEGHLGEIPNKLATFHEFKQKLLDQSENLHVSKDALNKVLSAVEGQFIRPLAQTIDRVLISAKSHLVLRTKVVEYQKRIEELEEKLQQETTTSNSNDVSSSTEKKREIIQPSSTMATPQKKTPATTRPAPTSDAMFYPEQLVETVIRYGSEEEIWINATINGYNQEDGTYNLCVQDPENFKVNPEAIHVPENLIRNKKRKFVKRRSTKRRKKPAIDLLNEADSSGASGSKPIQTRTEGDMGCYLTVNTDGDGFLMLNWSQTPVDNAFLFFRPRKKVPGFKFNNNRGREELLRNLHQTRFFMGCMNFFKLAQQFEADIVQLESGFNDEIWPLKYIINNQTFLHIVPRFEFFDTSYCESVVCVHAADDTFEGVSKQPVVTFLQVGSGKGSATSLKPKKVGDGKKKKKKRSRKKL